MSPERRLLQENRPARTRLYVAVSLALLAAGTWLVLAWLLSAVVNAVFIEHQALTQVINLLALMLALLLVRGVLMAAGDIVAQHAATRVKQDLRTRLTAQLFALGPAYTRGERTGELVHAVVEAVETLDEYISQYLPARYLAGLVPALVFIAIAFLDPWTLPVLLFTGPILILLLALIGGRAKDLTARRFVEMAWMRAHFLDMLQGLATLKMFGRSEEQSETIETISRQYGNTTMDVLRTAFQTSLVLEMAATAATAFVAIEVSIRLMNGVLPFDRALTVLLLTPEFFLPMRQLALKYHAGTLGKTAAERIYAILDTPAPAAVATPAPDAVAVSVPAAPLRQTLPAQLDLQFDDVAVTFDNGTRSALDGLNLKIPQGQTVALVGATGAGKTTVANLVLRFVEPTRGKITVGGVPLNTLDPALWRTQIGWVSQHPHLFHGTVAENLRLAQPDADMDALIAAARTAHAHEFISKLPRGYETLLGERGARLSGGEIQRLALARAFLKNAPLLILDEATSHLDRRNEELVQAALADLLRTRTVLIIAHRLQMVQSADVVHVMADGRIIETHTPHSAGRGSAYGQLVAAYERGTL